MLGREVKPFRKLCKSFDSIELVTTDEKWMQISTGKWNEKNEEKGRKKDIGNPQ